MFEQFVLNKSHTTKMKSFIKIVKQMHVSDFPDGANSVNSHFFYKVKADGNGSINL